MVPSEGSPTRWVIQGSLTRQQQRLAGCCHVRDASISKEAAVLCARTREFACFFKVKGKKKFCQNYVLRSCESSQTKGKKERLIGGDGMCGFIHEFCFQQMVLESSGVEMDPPLA